MKAKRGADGEALGVADWTLREDNDWKPKEEASKEFKEQADQQDKREAGTGPQ